MTRYLLAVHGIPGTTPPRAEGIVRGTPVSAASIRTWEQRVRGCWQRTAPARAPHLEANGDDVVMHDGPFSENKERLGGFRVLAASTLDGALASGARAAPTCREAAEVRPFHEE